MAENESWKRELLRRISRRRMLAGGAALGAGISVVAGGTSVGQQAPPRPTPTRPAGPTPRLTPTRPAGPTPSPTPSRPQAPTPWPDTNTNNPRETIANLNSAFEQATGKGSNWPGTRKDYHLPFLFLRAFVGDTGTRPLPSTQSSQSPDILIERGVPLTGPHGALSVLGNTATVNTPNTVYAHVWNLGFAPAYDVLVEFAWQNNPIRPIFEPPDPINALGQTWVNLGARGSGDSHKLVMCPNPLNLPFTAGYQQPAPPGGVAEGQINFVSLLVRVRQFVTDPLGTLGTVQWESRLNRHIGTRPIIVKPPGVP